MCGLRRPKAAVASLQEERQTYFFLEWLDGEDDSMGADLVQKKTWINEVAREFIRLETLS